VLAIAFEGDGVRRLRAAESELGYELTKRLIEVVVERMQATRMRLLEPLPRDIVGEQASPGSSDSSSSSSGHRRFGPASPLELPHQP
jgi:hypothetical protein